MKKWARGMIVLPGLLCGFCSPAADFDGDGRGEPAIFRPSQCKWVAYGVTNFYFGFSTDQVLCDDFDGDGKSDAAIYRPSESLWTVRNVTRVWFGSVGDGTVIGGKSLRQQDYTVRPYNSADLIRALESYAYRSVFVPSGLYVVDRTIVVANVRRISGEGPLTTLIDFGESAAELRIQRNSCTVENLTIQGGGVSSRGSLSVDADYATVRNCVAQGSHASGFFCTSYSDQASFISCRALYAAESGFRGGGSLRPTMVNCSALDCTTGFRGVCRLSNCTASGGSYTVYGFRECEDVSSSIAFDCQSCGFLSCYRVSASAVEGEGRTRIGFHACAGVAACRVNDVTDEAYSWTFRDSDSCQ